MTALELQNKLEELKQQNKEKEQELRKEIAKQKRKERADFVKAVGEYMISKFPDFKTLDDFKNVFDSPEEDTFFRDWGKAQIKDMEEMISERNITTSDTTSQM